MAKYLNESSKKALELAKNDGWVKINDNFYARNERMMIEENTRGYFQNTIKRDELISQYRSKAKKELRSEK